jgi:TonB family protein
MADNTAIPLLSEKIAMKSPDDEISPSIGLMPIGTAITWLGCLIVGITGILVPAVRRTIAAKTFSPVQATVIHVDLTQNSSPAPNPAAQADQSAAQESAPPAAPPLPTVAAPSATIAFAIPTIAPAQTVVAAKAVPIESDATAATAVQQITFGVGEGQQPKPDYPIEAQIAREYGAVTIRYDINNDGSVSNAQVIKRCPYADLNQAALRGIRETWRFAPGPPRVAETEIDYAPK